jgi:hypothetical protein
VKAAAGLDLRERIAEKGTIGAAATAVGLPAEELDAILVGQERSWPRLRQRLADYLGTDRAELFPEFVSFDSAFEAGVTKRIEQGLPAKIADPTTLDRIAALFLDVRRPPKARPKRRR